MLTEYPYNLYRSQDDGETWNKIIIDNNLSKGIINVYSTFSDSLPADGDSYAVSVLVYNIYNYPDNLITLYDFTASDQKLLPISDEKIDRQKLKIEENNLDVILYYPYLDQQDEFVNRQLYHYYIPNYYQATYHFRNLNNTLFVASNEGVFSCNLK